VLCHAVAPAIILGGIADGLMASGLYSGVRTMGGYMYALQTEDSPATGLSEFRNGECPGTLYGGRTTKETTVTYQNDPNNPNNVRRRNGMRDETGYTGWIIGGVVAVAVILGIFMMTNRGDKSTALNNSPATTARTVPSTTGSAVPAQNRGMGTAGENRQAPAAPAVPAR